MPNPDKKVMADLFLDAVAAWNARPEVAADKIEQIVARLQEIAENLRQRGSQGHSPLDSSGIGDRVKARVIGPDGAIRQTIDTEASCPANF